LEGVFRRNNSGGAGNFGGIYSVVAVFGEAFFREAILEVFFRCMMW